MWWFGRKKWVVILRRGGVEVVREDGQKFRWEYPFGVVVNQEVVNRAELEKQWGGFWKQAGGKGRVWIVLGEEVTYQKIVSKEGSGAQQFWDEVPLNPETMGRKVVDEGNQMRLVATNKEIYEVVAGGIKGVRGEVVAVVPEVLISGGDVTGVWKDKNFVKRGNFLTGFKV